MKECPKCGTIYTDKTLAFCLSDGSPLSEDIRQRQTEEFSSSESVTEFSQNQPTEVLRSGFRTDETVVRTAVDSTPNGVSRGWIFATFGLLALILIGAFVGWMVISQYNDPVVANTNKSASNLEPESIEKTGKGSLVETKTPPKKASNTFRIVGVKSNDVLYIRPAPGSLKSYVGKIPPNGTGIKIVGTGKRVRKSVWVPVVYKGKRGWVNRRFLGKEK